MDAGPSPADVGTAPASYGGASDGASGASGTAFCNTDKKILIPFCDPTFPVVCADADGGPDTDGSVPPICPPPPWCPPPAESSYCSVCGNSPLYSSCFIWATAELEPVPSGLSPCRGPNAIETST